MKPYHYVQQNALGRWCVIHDVPRTGAVAVDVDCLTKQAAEHEAAWMNYERECGTEPGYAVDAAGTFTG